MIECSAPRCVTVQPCTDVFAHERARATLLRYSSSTPVEARCCPNAILPALWTPTEKSGKCTKGPSPPPPPPGPAADCVLDDTTLHATFPETPAGTGKACALLGTAVTGKCDVG